MNLKNEKHALQKRDEQIYFFSSSICKSKVVQTTNFELALQL